MNFIKLEYDGAAEYYNAEDIVAFYTNINKKKTEIVLRGRKGSHIVDTPVHKIMQLIEEVKYRSKK